MRFIITMNMPSRNNPIHQIVCEHPVTSLQKLLDALATQDFIIVDEYYRNSDAPRGTDSYYKVGETAINHQYVGKIKVFEDNHVKGHHAE
jgi:hypothetical protein